MDHFINWFFSTGFVEANWFNTQIILTVLRAHDFINSSIEKAFLWYTALIKIIRARLDDISNVCVTIAPWLGLTFEAGVEGNTRISALAWVYSHIHGIYYGENCKGRLFYQ